MIFGFEAGMSFTSDKKYWYKQIFNAVNRLINREIKENNKKLNSNLLELNLFAVTSRYTNINKDINRPSNLNHNNFFDEV